MTAPPSRAAADPMEAADDPLDLGPDTPTRSALASDELAAGRMVLLRDDCERGGEGDLLIAAEFADADAVNFMATEARGLVCLALSTERCDELGLEQIGNRGNQSSLGDSAMVSIEAARGGHHRHLGRRPRPHDRRRDRPRRAAPATSSSPATSSRCAPGPAACSSARAGPRPPST